MRKRYLTLAMLFAVFVAAALGILAMLPPRPGVTKANFDRIQNSMTENDIDTIFGAKKASDFSVPGPSSFPHMPRILTWQNDDGARAQFVLIGGKACGKTWHPSNEAFYAKVRRWFRQPPE